MTSFTEHLWWKLAETLKVKSRSARHPRAKPSLIHDNASILRTRVVQSLKYHRCCRHRCCIHYGFYYTHRQIKSVFGLVIFWISTSWAGWLVQTSMKRLLGLYKFPATIKRDISVRFHRFIVLLMFVQGYKKNQIYRLDMIIYPAPIIQCYLYRHPLTVCTVYTVFIPMYLLHFIIFSLLDGQQTSATVNKFHLDT